MIKCLFFYNYAIKYLPNNIDAAPTPDWDRITPNEGCGSKFHFVAHDFILITERGTINVVLLVLLINLSIICLLKHNDSMPFWYVNYNYQSRGKVLMTLTLKKSISTIMYMK